MVEIYEGGFKQPFCREIACALLSLVLFINLHKVDQFLGWICFE